MHPEAHALADATLLRRDVFDPAHQAETFVAIDQGDIERLALRRVHDRRGIDSAEPFADAPFQLAAAGVWAKHARIKHGTLRLAAELIGQFAAREMILV